MRTRILAMCRIVFVGFVLFAAPHAGADVIDGVRPYAERSGTETTSIVAPAEVGFFDAYQNATVEVTGGQIDWLSLHDNSAASISGGDVSWLQLYDNSSVRISGIDSLTWLVLRGASSRAEIVANNVLYQNGRLSGSWGNGTPFDFFAVTDPRVTGNAMPSNILISSVPEPSSALMLLSGFALLAARRARRFMGLYSV